MKKTSAFNPGDQAVYTVEIGRGHKLEFDVKIVEVTSSFGRDRVVISPLTGSGKAPVEKNLKPKK